MPRYPLLAARLLRQAGDTGAPRAGDRQRSLATIRATLAAGRRRRLRRLWSLAGAVAAAAAALLFVGQSRLREQPAPSPAGQAIAAYPLGPGVIIEQGSAVSALDSRKVVSPGAKISTSLSAGVDLRLPSGSSLKLHEHANLTVRSHGPEQRFELKEGVLDVQVAKLASGDRFIINTPDAELEVRGTAFHVDVREVPFACSIPSRTLVRVDEGIVEVRTSGVAVRVAAGGVWPVGCRDESPSQAAVQDSVGDREQPGPSRAVARDRREAESPVAHGADAKSGVPESRSQLAEHNDLFQRAAAAGRSGDVAGALAGYEQLISKYPRSALAENAIVERMRLLTQSHAAAAQREARRYLARHPHGFARAEAQRIAHGP
jgi:ferric-dicitrate binding protein FerR (iron transport regulator)